MKKHLLFLSLAAAMLAGCSVETDAPDNGGSRYSEHPIAITSQVVGGAIEGSPVSKSRAVADPTKTMTLFFVRADETGHGTGVYGAYGTTPLSATRAAGAGSQALTFNPEQLYLADEVRSRFTGWWPAATSFTGGEVSWTIDGATDILIAAEQSGSYSSLLPNMVFNHALSQLQFWFYTPDANMQISWGEITKISVKAQPTTCKYNLVTGAATGGVTIDATTTADLVATNLIAGALPITKTQMCNPMMIAPQALGTVLKLYIETSTGAKVTVPLTAAKYLPGEAYKINLKFTSKQIESSATVSDWGTPIDVTAPIY